jgi:hypothetical protein
LARVRVRCWARCGESTLISSRSVLTLARVEAEAMPDHTRWSALQWVAYSVQRLAGSREIASESMSHLASCLTNVQLTKHTSDAASPQW